MPGLDEESLLRRRALLTLPRTSPVGTSNVRLDHDEGRLWDRTSENLSTSRLTIGSNVDVGDLRGQGQRLRDGQSTLAAVAGNLFPSTPPPTRPQTSGQLTTANSVFAPADRQMRNNINVDMDPNQRHLFDYIYNYQKDKRVWITQETAGGKQERHGNHGTIPKLPAKQGDIVGMMEWNITVMHWLKLQGMSVKLVWDQLQSMTNFEEHLKCNDWEWLEYPITPTTPELTNYILTTDGGNIPQSVRQREFEYCEKNVQNSPQNMNFSSAISFLEQALRTAASVNDTLYAQMIIILPGNLVRIWALIQHTYQVATKSQQLALSAEFAALECPVGTTLPHFQVTMSKMALALKMIKCEPSDVTKKFIYAKAVLAIYEEFTDRVEPAVEMMI